MASAARSASLTRDLLCAVDLPLPVSSLGTNQDPHEAVGLRGNGAELVLPAAAGAAEVRIRVILPAPVEGAAGLVEVSVPHADSSLGEARSDSLALRAASQERWPHLLFRRSRRQSCAPSYRFSAWWSVNLHSHSSPSRRIEVRRRSTYCEKHSTHSSNSLVLVLGVDPLGIR